MPIPPAPSPSGSAVPATVPAGAPPAAEAQGPVLGPERFEPLAGLLAILLPGAGHVVLGERRRGVLIGAGVLGLFLGGMLIGGIDAIDRKEDPIWFIGQAMVGPVAFGVDYYHQEFCKIREPANIQSVHAKERYSYRSALPTEARDPSGLPAVNAPGARPPNSKSLGRMNELGTLFATIAGMLNLIVIIDAFYHARAVAPRPGAAA